MSPLGLFVLLGMSRLNPGRHVDDWVLPSAVVGWMYYVALTACCLASKRRRRFFVVYIILCVSLLFNFAGCAVGLAASYPMLGHE
jgi:hypothetical protein